MPCWSVGKSITAAHRSYGRFRHRSRVLRASPLWHLMTSPRPRSNWTGVTKLQIGGLQRKMRAAKPDFKFRIKAVSGTRKEQHDATDKPGGLRDSCRHFSYRNFLSRSRPNA